MNTFQIVLKTVISTLDLLLAISVLKIDDAEEGLKRALAVIVLLNLAGVWI